MRAVRTLAEETRLRAAKSIQLKTHTEQNSQRKAISQQTESEALFQQKLDRLVEQKRKDQRRDRQLQQRLDQLSQQRQRVAAMLRGHIERNEKLNQDIYLGNDASKELSASSRLSQDLTVELVASFNNQVTQELGVASARLVMGRAMGLDEELVALGDPCEHQDERAIVVTQSLAFVSQSAP